MRLSAGTDGLLPDDSNSGNLASGGAARQLAAAARSRGQVLSSSNGSPAPQCVSYSGGDSVQLLSASTGEVVGWASLGAAAPAFTAADDPMLPNVTAPSYSSQARDLAQRNASYSGVFRNPRMRFNISLLPGQLFAGAAAPAAAAASGRGALLSNNNNNGHAGVHQLTAAVRDPGTANLRAYTFTDQPSSCPIAEMHFAQEAALPCAATAAAVDVDLPALFGCNAGANGGQPFSMGLFLQLSVRTAASANRACAASAASLASTSPSAWSWAFGQEAPVEVAGSSGVAVEVEEGLEQRPECAVFEVVVTCNPAACGDASPPPPSPEPRPPRPRHNMPVADGATRSPPPAPPLPAPLAPAPAPLAPSPPSPRSPPRRVPGASGGARAPPMPPFPVVDLDSSSPPQYPPLSVADGPLAADVRAPPPSLAQTGHSLPAPAPAPAPVPQPAPSTPATTSSSTQPPAAPSPESPKVIVTFMPPPPHRTTEGGGFGGGSAGTNVGGGFGGSRTATVSGTTDGGAAASTTTDSSAGSGSGSGTIKPTAIAGIAAGAAVAGVAVIGVAALVMSGKVAALFAATGSSALAAITAGCGITGASAAVAAGTGGGANAAAAAAGGDGWYFAFGRRSTVDSEASSEADPHSTRVSMNGAYDGAAAAGSPGGASAATASSGHTACSGQEPMVAMLMASISLPLANDGRQELW